MGANGEAAREKPPPSRRDPGCVAARGRQGCEAIDTPTLARCAGMNPETGPGGKPPFGKQPAGQRPRASHPAGGRQAKPATGLLSHRTPRALCAVTRTMMVGRELRRFAAAARLLVILPRLAAGHRGQLVHVPAGNVRPVVPEVQRPAANLGHRLGLGRPRRQ